LIYIKPLLIIDEILDKIKIHSLQLLIKSNQWKTVVEGRNK